MTFTNLQTERLYVAWCNDVWSHFPLQPKNDKTLIIDFFVKHNVLFSLNYEEKAHKAGRD